MSADIGTPVARRSALRRIFRRGPWEMLATILIGLGVVMLMQPFSIDIYSYSFITILTGTVMFMIVSKFPD